MLVYGTERPCAVQPLETDCPGNGGDVDVSQRGLAAMVEDPFGEVRNVFSDYSVLALTVPPDLKLDQLGLVYGMPIGGCDPAEFLVEIVIPF